LIALDFTVQGALYTGVSNPIKFSGLAARCRHRLNICLNIGLNDGWNPDCDNRLWALKSWAIGKKLIEDQTVASGRVEPSPNPVFDKSPALAIRPDEKSCSVQAKYRMDRESADRFVDQPHQMTGWYPLIDAGRKRLCLIPAVGLEDRVDFFLFSVFNIIILLIIFKDFLDSQINPDFPCPA